MTLIPGISALSPIIGQELDGQTFKALSGQLVLNVAALSPIKIVLGADGMTINPPTTTNTLVFDAATKQLTSTSNGVASIADLSSLASATPFSGTAAGLVPAGPSAPLDGKFLQADGKWVSVPVTTTVSNTVSGVGALRTLTTTVNGVTGASVGIPDTNDQALSIAGNVISLVNGGSITLPAAPATTNVLAIDTIGKTITSTVNGVVATISTATLDDEGVTLAFSAGNLELKNSSGAVLSTTPVPDLDAQVISMDATGKISLTGSAGTVQTTNVGAWVPATNALRSTVNGVVSTTVVPLVSTAGAGLAPALPSPSTGRFLKDDGTWGALSAVVSETISWVSASNSVALASGSSAIVPIYAGTANVGLVPAAPAAPLVGKFLQADGTWATVAAPTCASISALFPVASVSATATTALLGSDCQSYKTQALTSAFGTPIGRILL